MFILHHNNRNIKYGYNNKERVIFLWQCQHFTCPLTLREAKQKCHRRDRVIPVTQWWQEVAEILLPVTLTSTAFVFQHRLNKSPIQLSPDQLASSHMDTFVPVKLFIIYWAKTVMLLTTSHILAFNEKLCQGALICSHLTSKSQALEQWLSGNFTSFL